MLSDISFYELNDFKNLKIIGNGSGGKISKGESKDFGQIVVKEFFWSRRKPLEEYKREVEILVKYRHPNIVQLYGILWNGSDSSRYLGYVMEYVEGGSLHKVIYDRTKNYDTAQICRWVKQIALGLQYLHKKQIIHRDIKPANILVAGSQLKLADFGIARDVDVSITAGVGTFHYMAPEVITTRRYGQAADIYSLALTIWELFHRTKPYTALEGNDLILNLQAVREGARPVFTSEQIDENTARFIQSETLKSVECFDPESEVWIEFADMPQPLSGHSLVSYEGRLILLGGCTEELKSSSSVLELINGEWGELPPLRCGCMWKGTSEFRTQSGSNIRREILARGAALHNQASDLSAVVTPEVFVDLQKYRQ